MTIHPTQLLSEYLDDELTAAERVRIEHHLSICAECRGTLDELRRVLARAQALEDRPIGTELWPGIAALIGATPLKAQRRFTFSMPQLIAAGFALVLASAGSTGWFTYRAFRTAAQSPVALASERTPAPTQRVLPARAADAEYDAAVADLQRVLKNQGGRLDSTTQRILERNLTLIDRAIAEAERALASDPSSAYLSGHLTETRLRKLDLLRRAATLAGSAS